MLSFFELTDHKMEAGRDAYTVIEVIKTAPGHSIDSYGWTPKADGYGGRAYTFNLEGATRVPPAPGNFADQPGFGPVCPGVVVELADGRRECWLWPLMTCT